MSRERKLDIKMSRFHRLLQLIYLMLIASRCQAKITGKPDSSSTATPVVLWHGMGDSCCFPFSLGQIKAILEERIPGVRVKSVKIGDSLAQDVENSYFRNVNEQVRQVCEELAQDETMRHGYNAIGFSQGGQFLRAVAQRCPEPPMLKLITLGAQHQGVYGLPNCASLEHYLCNHLRQVLHYAAYFKFIQDKLVQAEYWHDPMKEDDYKRRSIFLADINNELRINETYKRNLKRLEKLVLVKFENDTMVEPRESEWFGFYKPGQAVETESLRESAIYKEDRLGLREMDEDNKLHFLSVEGNHLQFTDAWFVENVIEKYLK
ncbi:palmitoyl-protein thioesterase 1 [Phymastichus coffea]|uniref:palmitoyl-protein thioesterase 1 n=1 Tax=Phymastichus coffea TaxID=108790 RepID=UPI00273C8818|nr:palmitoyl-protein thioesterase 1 [Phymastichus coffea]